MHVNKTYIILLLCTFIFSSESKFEKISFESANPFSFKDIMTNIENLETQVVSGILTIPDNVNEVKIAAKFNNGELLITLPKT